jgi:protein-tyrosine-phosphatase
VSTTWVPGWIRHFSPEHSRKTLRLGDFLPGPPHRVEDPWGLSDEVYAMTFKRIADAVQRLAKVLEPSER